MKNKIFHTATDSREVQVEAKVDDYTRTLKIDVYAGTGCNYVEFNAHETERILTELANHTGHLSVEIPFTSNVRIVRETGELEITQFRETKRYSANIEEWERQRDDARRVIDSYAANYSVAVAAIEFLKAGEAKMEDRNKILRKAGYDIDYIDAPVPLKNLVDAVYRETVD